MKLIESIAVDQAAEHLVTFMQTQQVGLRVTDTADATTGYVMRLLGDGDNRILMRIWLNLLACCSQSGQAPCSTVGSAVCLTICERMMKTVIQETWEPRRKTGARIRSLRGSVAGKHAEQSDSLLDILDMADVMIEINRDKPAAGFISHADDFMISAKQEDVEVMWDKTVAALKGDWPWD